MTTTIMNTIVERAERKVADVAKNSALQVALIANNITFFDYAGNELSPVDYSNIVGILYDCTFIKVEELTETAQETLNTLFNMNNDVNPFEEYGLFSTNVILQKIHEVTDTTWSSWKDFVLEMRYFNKVLRKIENV